MSSTIYSQPSRRVRRQFSIPPLSIDFEPEYMLRWPETPMDMSFEPEAEVPPPLSSRVVRYLDSGEQCKISKPAGEVGRPGSSRKGYSLADVLKWEEGLLEAVQARVALLASKHLDEVTISKQPLEKLQKVYKEAGEAYPILLRYKNHWVTNDMLKVHLKNKVYSVGKAGSKAT